MSTITASRALSLFLLSLEGVKSPAPIARSRHRLAALAAPLALQGTGRALRLYIGGRRTGPVFLNQWTGEALKPGGIYLLLKRLALSCGVTSRWNPHSWRHGAARGMLRRGANLAQVSQILGHSDVS